MKRGKRKFWQLLPVRLLGGIRVPSTKKPSDSGARPLRPALARAGLDRLGYASFATAVALLSSTTALAAGGGGEGEHEPHVTNWWDATGEVNHHAPALGWMFFTFLVFVAIVVYFVRPALASTVAERHALVKKAILEAKQAKDEAIAKKREYEERLARLDDDMKKLRADFESQGRAELERLEAAGKQAAQRILKDAETTIKAELQRAEHELRKEAARLALEVAEERLAKAISDGDEARFKKDFISGLAS